MAIPDRSRYEVAGYCVLRCDTEKDPREILDRRYLTNRILNVHGPYQNAWQALVVAQDLAEKAFAGPIAAGGLDGAAYFQVVAMARRDGLVVESGLPILCGPMHSYYIAHGLGDYRVDFRTQLDLMERQKTLGELLEEQETQQKDAHPPVGHRHKGWAQAPNSVVSPAVQDWLKARWGL